MEVFDSIQVIEAFAKLRAYRILGIGHAVSSSLMDVVPEYRADVPSDTGQHILEMARDAINLRASRTKIVTVPSPVPGIPTPWWL
jgi:exonuclease VII large subunit